MNRLITIGMALVWACYVAEAGYVAFAAMTPPPKTAICETDTDCMRFCPKDDAECDGGR